MAKPAVRIKLDREVIGEVLVRPEIKFSRSNDGKKSILRIAFGLESIGNIVEDSELPVNDPAIKDNYRDALLTKDFFARRKLSVVFSPDGVNGTLMTITANLPTKVPGTGSRIAEKRAGAKKAKR